MAEHRSCKNGKPKCSNNSNSGRGVNSLLPNVQSQWGQEQGSISSSRLLVNPVMQVLRPPVFQLPVTWQGCNSIVNQNFLQPSLSQTCFHRPDQRNQQREVHSSRGHGQARSIEALRFWERMPSDSEGGSGFIFSVMSYNVLAQNLLDQHSYLYAQHQRAFLGWQVRWHNLLTEITKFQPNILCFQEVETAHLDTYYSHLASMGYLTLFKQRTGIRRDGCAIFYKHQTLNLIEHTTVEFKQPNINILDRDNVAIIAKFAPQTYPNKEFVVATTHLLYNPKRQDVRLAQTQVLLTEIDRIGFKNGGYVPIILTGDLNSTPNSAVVQFITKGRLKYEHLSPRSLEETNTSKYGKTFIPPSLRITDQCQHADLLPNRQNNKSINRFEELQLIKIKNSERFYNENTKEKATDNDLNLFSSGTLSHQLSLESVYKHKVNGDFEATTYQDEWVCVDYIFFRNKFEGLTLLERLKLPTVRQLGDEKIPNKDFGSDHLSLLAKFKLTV